MKHCRPHIPVLTCVLLALACAPDASRDNPFDPALNGGATASGKILGFYEPRIPLSNAEVTLKPLGQIQETDAGGSFSFNGLTPGDYTIVAKKDGYRSDSLTFSVEGDVSLEDRFVFLNAIPQVVRSSYVSRHIDVFFPGEFYDAIFSLVVDDLDGVADIDSLRFDIPGLDYSKSFEITTRPDSFFVRILDIEFDFGSPADNLFQLTENDAFVTLVDMTGTRNVAGPFSLRRIIRDTPRPISPDNFETTDASPQFRWQRTHLPFDFTYSLRLERNVGGVGVEILTVDNIDQDDLTFTFPDSLPDGVYQWFLSVEDNLMNISRSQRADFVVANQE